MAQRKTWREKATQKAIIAKINRKKNPVTSYARLAEEFGAPVSSGSPYYGAWTSKYSGTSYPAIPASGPAASSSFRKHVKETLGTEKVFTGKLKIGRSNNVLVFA